ncbi:ras-related and estrogen-regulated growth inhibitor-like isoform X1 [Xenia sp. Carnegie-2017]|uniref:ras-related and estrogen-regulated growth inhibitor-like isoform X1 n=1 Tax=Xenia sp. Carnegie-2017 TaxID=2897299 RepID=UPI001F04E883|nr:ras-related and estrogen-regulated growth inhibitor-like isoform X1 [Xenia sp. Carnegie-2017]
MTTPLTLNIHVVFLAITMEVTSTSKPIHVKKMNSIKDRDFNIVLLGQGGVGKSALLVRFSTGKFIYEYSPTLEFNCEMTEVIDEEAADMKIFDTANTNEPHVYHNEYQGFLVVYSITDRMSFETAKQLVKLIREVKKMKAPGGLTCVGLVGNKVDLTHDRIVSHQEASDFAIEHECLFHESSALSNTNVKQVFHAVVLQMRKCRNCKKKDKKGKNFFSR